MSKHESGIITKHATAIALRQEVHLVSAKLIRNLFDNCGSRGIRSLHLSCNRATRQYLIPDNATEAEKMELLRQAPLAMSSIYRLSIDGKDARTISSWRTASTADILNRCRIVSDGLTDMTILRGGSMPAPTQDPDSPLEF